MSETSYRERRLAWARRLRGAMDTAGGKLDDRDASESVEIYPVLADDGALVKAGTRINWQGRLMRAAVDLWDRAESWPDSAPALWEEINYRDGARVIPDVITAGLAFAKGELGWWHVDGCVYESVFDGANVWTPEGYPVAWRKVVEE